MHTKMHTIYAQTPPVLGMPGAGAGSFEEKMGSYLGVLKIAAGRRGMTVGNYTERCAREKWCSVCKEWHPRDIFAPDLSRGDKLATGCRESISRRARNKYIKKERVKGRRYVAARDGDRKQARGRINGLINRGVIPDPDDIPCEDCGHLNAAGAQHRRHSYDHYLGYDAEHHEDVQAVCYACHGKRTADRGEMKRCRNQK